MPFTPFHFGPHATVALPLRRYIDLPVFIGANIIIDIEPFLVMIFNLNYPLHGYCHTLLIGGLLGLAWGTIAYPFRSLIGKAMQTFRFSYSPTFWKMAISGLLGVWLHILFYAPLYYEMKPFYPSGVNPCLNLLEMETVYTISLLCFFPALMMYYAMVARRQSRLNRLEASKPSAD